MNTSSKGPALKTLPKLVLLALLLLVPLAAGAHAQDEGTPTPPPGAPQGPPPGGGGGLLMKLNLTPEQRTRLREIRRQSEPEARALARRLRMAHRALDESVYSDDVDETAVAQRTRELADAQAALVHLRAQTELRVRRVLTPEQLQTFRGLRQQAMRQRLLQRQAGPAARRDARRNRRLRGAPPPLEP